MKTEFVSKRAKIYADVPDEKWNDWRWQLSNRLNTVEDIEKVLPLTDSERKALQTQGLFRVDVTPYFISLIDPEDPNDPTRLQIIPRAEEMQAFTAMMEDSLAESRHSPVQGWFIGTRRRLVSCCVTRNNSVRLVLPVLHPFTYCW